eukprot:349641-Chlamydomonas_euryale.AAC.10
MAEGIKQRAGHCHKGHDITYGPEPHVASTNSPRSGHRFRETTATLLDCHEANGKTGKSTHFPSILASWMRLSLSLSLTGAAVTLFFGSLGARSDHSTVPGLLVCKTASEMCRITTGTGRASFPPPPPRRGC